MKRRPMSTAAIHRHRHAATPLRIDECRVDDVEGMLCPRPTFGHRRSPPSATADADGARTHSATLTTMTAFASMQTLVALLIGSVLTLGTLRLLELVSG